MKNNNENNYTSEKNKLLIILKYIKAFGTSSIYGAILYLLCSDNFEDYDSLIISIGALASFISTTNTIDKQKYKDENKDKTKIIK